MLAEAVFCMAMAAYHEARGEGKEGVIAVMEVIQNRVDSPRYPNNACDVVKQSKQFSAFNDGYAKSERKTLNSGRTQQLADILPLAWRVARKQAGYNNLPDNVLHYHATSVNPKWAITGKAFKQIKNHVFYAGIR